MKKQVIEGMNPQQIQKNFKGNLGFQKAKPYVMVYDKNKNARELIKEGYEMAGPIQRIALVNLAKKKGHEEQIFKGLVEKKYKIDFKK